MGFNLKDFLCEGDGPEYIMCSICRFNRVGERCVKMDSMMNYINPSSRQYFNVCKSFSPNPTPITTTQFDALMKAADELCVDDPTPGLGDFGDTKRYMMEYIMCTTLITLGYTKGVKLFQDQCFELPFYIDKDKKSADKTCPK